MTVLAPDCSVLIPIKAPSTGKTRLAGVLEPDSRERLILAMLKRVITAARGCPAVTRVCLVNADERGLPADVIHIPDRGLGLNPALAEALQAMAIDGPRRIVIAAADLPQITSMDFAMLADVPDDAIGIAPDRHATGTNALSLPAAALGSFTPQFGPQSYLAHRLEATRLGFRLQTLLSDGLAKDVDEPADLADAKLFF